LKEALKNESTEKQHLTQTIEELERNLLTSMDDNSSLIQKLEEVKSE